MKKVTDGVGTEPVTSCPISNHAYLKTKREAIMKTKLARFPTQNILTTDLKEYFSFLWKMKKFPKNDISFFSFTPNGNVLFL